MAKPSDLKEVGKRIAQARKKRGLNPNQLARKADISWANLIRYEEGKNEPGAGKLLRIADALGVTVDWLLGRDGAAEQEEARPLDVAVRVADGVQGPGRLRDVDFRAVPLVSGSIAAGKSRIVEEAIEEYALIHVSQLGRRGDVVAVRVSREMGRSMLPLIQPGAVVAIDRRDKVITPEGIYAVRDEAGGCTLKRLQWTPPRLWLIPENRDEPVSHLDLPDEDPGARIVGRVVWAYQPFV
ncbi:MAG: helix-turn-helix domain-containing protein [Candidatus Tectomicrobia bacterium]|uniref:Helix-turn-helix domain-containing protein n=1 Tax=Tectimicrobiota bacterium TaxID=2528274 RepID=A0A932I1G1_UNCTE|nr:helix-turn-helix domain-containing protein [Candidatus Tectomicrobia bacterium]